MHKSVTCQHTWREKSHKVGLKSCAGDLQLIEDDVPLVREECCQI